MNEKLQDIKGYVYLWGVVAKWIRAPHSSSGVSVQQSVGLSTGRDTCVSSLSKTLYCNCFSPPRGEWVPCEGREGSFD